MTITLTATDSRGIARTWEVLTTPATHRHQPWVARDERGIDRIRANSLARCLQLLAEDIEVDVCGECRGFGRTEHFQECGNCSGTGRA